jgi:hypothetical protein
MHPPDNGIVRTKVAYNAASATKHNKTPLECVAWYFVNRTNVTNENVPKNSIKNTLKFDEFSFGYNTAMF